MKRKKRKAKRVTADEGYDYGPLRLMRFGRFTVLQNRSKSAQHQVYTARLADQHAEVCREIDQLVSRIAETVAQLAPLPLLLLAYREFLYHNTDLSSETEAGEEANLSRLTVEYLQSMVSAVPPADTQKEAPTDEQWESLTGDIRDLYKKLLSGYFLTRSAWAQENEPGFDKDREAFAVSAQMRWLIVRGTRYVAHDSPSFRDLLSPHDDELDKLFGLTTEGILYGLTKIGRNLTRGHLDAFEELERFRRVTLEAVGRHMEETGSTDQSHELMDQIIERHGWQKWRERVTKDALGFGLFDMTSSTGWPTKLLDRLSWRPGEDRDFSGSGAFPWLAVEGNADLETALPRCRWASLLLRTLQPHRPRLPHLPACDSVTGP